jgi:hypothetical protein
MNSRSGLAAASLALALVVVSVSTCILPRSAIASADPSHPKNWTAPSYKIYGQKLCDQIMANHPELISVTFHGVPPGADEGTFTMFAGSFPERIGNVDDPDDVMVIKTGITILDPRWHRAADPIRKFVVMTPLRDASGENIGLLVLAYHNPLNMAKSEREFLEMGTAIRDELQFRIKSMAALFERA